jgi:hypothetical protein
MELTLQVAEGRCKREKDESLRFVEHSEARRIDHSLDYLPITAGAADFLHVVDIGET